MLFKLVGLTFARLHPGPNLNLTIASTLTLTLTLKLFLTQPLLKSDAYAKMKLVQKWLVPLVLKSYQITSKILSATLYQLVSKTINSINIIFEKNIIYIGLIKVILIFLQDTSVSITFLKVKNLQLV